MTKRLEIAFQKGAKRRLHLVLLLASLFWLVLIGRLFQIQILEAGRYQVRAQSQNFREATQKAQRGAIYDRHGMKLAFNITAQSFFGVPDSIVSPKEIASKFSRNFGKGYDYIFNNLQSGRKFFWIIRQTEASQAELVESWGFKGVYVREEFKRTKPLGGLAQDLIGLTDVDNKGLSGLELYYDSLLAGEDGSEVLQKDARGELYNIKELSWKEAKPGYSLGLTLDVQLQWILESKLRQGIIQTKSESGFGLLMDPLTGEILALATVHNPNLPSLENQGRLRPLTDQFEPGSTLKAFTAAAALEEKVKTPEDIIYAEKGKWPVGVGKRVLHDIHEYENLTFQEAVAFSSNIALAKTGLEIGRKRLYRYLRDFGFGFKTGIELPGETSGKLQSYEDWNRMTLISNSIGYGISVTALQLASAYAALANGGTLLKPYVVKAILDSRGQTVKEFSPTPLRQVISPETARTVREFLKLVVEEGTGTSAKLEGVEIGGKTGTARKVKIGTKGYSDEYLSSFVGFFPVEKPRYIGLIALDSPKGMHYGGQTAAPVFREIVRDILSLPSTPTFELIRPENLTTDRPGEPVQTVAAKPGSGEAKISKISQGKQVL